MNQTRHREGCHFARTLQISHFCVSLTITTTTCSRFYAHQFREGRRVPISTGIPGLAFAGILGLNEQPTFRNSIFRNVGSLSAYLHMLTNCLLNYQLAAIQVFLVTSSLKTHAPLF